MKYLKVLLGFLLVSMSLASLTVASEPNWQPLIGNSIINLAGGSGGNVTCAFLGSDPNCANYIIGAIFFIVFLALALFTGIPSEYSIPMGMLIFVFLAGLGWLPGYLGWAMGMLGGFVFFLILYRVIGG